MLCTYAEAGNFQLLSVLPFKTFYEMRNSILTEEEDWNLTLTSLFSKGLSSSVAVTLLVGTSYEVCKETKVKCYTKNAQILIYQRNAMSIILAKGVSNHSRLFDTTSLQLKNAVKPAFPTTSIEWPPALRDHSQLLSQL